jgi:plastocyanin
MINPRVVSIFVVAAVAAIFTLGVATSIFTIFPSGQQQAAAQQENTITGTTPSTTNQTTASASNNKTFYLFNTELEGLDTATTGISHYIYSLPVIVANKGDSVTVHLFNIPETEEEEGGTEEGGTEEGGTEEGGTEEGGTEEGGTEEGGTEEVERHAFIIDTPPYSVNIDTAPGELGNATFTADQEGIFQYYCKYHPQTMRGELVVLPQSQGASAPST